MKPIQPTLVVRGAVTAALAYTALSGAPLAHGSSARQSASAASAAPHGATITLSPPVASGVAGSLRAARAESLATRQLYGLGLSRASAMASSGTARTELNQVRSLSAAALPASVDLSQYDPPVGNQGSVNSCASWSTGYTLLGWYANRYGVAGSPYAPMYIYSQLTGGANVGTSFEGNFGIEEQGIDTQSDYVQGNYDYQDQPTAAERANAAHYRVTGYTSIYQQGSGNAQQAIESALAAGQPIVVGIPVYSSFMYASASAPLVDVPPAGATYFGGHGIVAVKYDANGLWIQNQWGTSWGLNGFAELSWAFVNQDLWSAYTISGFQGPSSSGPTPTPVPGQPSATSTPAPGQPTATPVAAPHISVSPSSASPGTPLTISGTGFGAGSALVYWNGSPYAQVGLSNGAFSLAATLSSSAAPGSRSVSATNPATGQQASTTFTVLGAPATATPTAPAPTATRTPVTPAPTATRTPVTPAPTATHTPVAPTGTPAASTPTTTPSGAPRLIVSPGSGAPGTNIMIVGDGFRPGESISLYWNSGLVTALTANNVGGFMYPVRLSSTASPGTRAVLASGSSGDQAGATFTVLA